MLLGLLKVLGALPLSVRIILGRIGGTLYSLVPTREKRIAKLQLRALLGVQNPSPIIRRMFSGLGQTVMECLNLLPYIKDVERYVDCPGYPIYERLSKEPGPIVVLTAHTGNWDLLAAYAVGRGIQLTTIAKEARNKSFQQALESIRSAYGSKTIWRSNRAGVREIRKDLSENRMVAALIDQDTIVTSKQSLFFGAPVKTPSGLIDIANEYNSRYMACFIARKGWKKYEIAVTELPNNCPTEEILEAYHRALEEQIRRYPDQWVWFHKRWRSMEDGKRLSTAEYLEYLTHFPNANSQTQSN